MTKEERRAIAAKAAQSALQTVAVVMQSEAAINKAKGDDQPQSRSRELIAEGRAVIAGMKRNGYSDILWEKILDAIESEWSETGLSVPVADLDIIGRREKGDENKGRAWWSGGTWLRPGEVVAVLTLPPERQGG